MTDHISAAAVAQFLQSNPDFFVEHADLFAGLEVPHPHQSRAISLGERQILTLRERLKEFEFRLAGLMRNAALNEVTSDKMTHWCARLLAEADASKLPGAILVGLAEQFNLPDVAMRVWGLTLAEEGVAAPVTDDIKTFANEFACRIAVTRPSLLRQPGCTPSPPPWRFCLCASTPTLPRLVCW